MTDNKELYLDLMKKALTCLLWNEAESFRPINLTDPRPFYKRLVLSVIIKHLSRTGKQIMEPVSFDLDTRSRGADWPPPPFAHTMIREFDIREGTSFG